MFRKHSRVIAAVVLSFFTWTSGGVFSVAHAAQDAYKKAEATEQQKKGSEGAEERFSRLTEELSELVADPKAEVEKKKQRLLASKAQFDALDKDIRKGLRLRKDGFRMRDSRLRSWRGIISS